MVRPPPATLAWTWRQGRVRLVHVVSGTQHVLSPYLAFIRQESSNEHAVVRAIYVDATRVLTQSAIVC